ncbi:MAG: glycoside hydrolase family 5 protein [Lachnospiraceae bacterium]|nr:glycoside hydrolase family 5 protein [Lachnospiraceae bacterium]
MKNIFLNKRSVMLITVISLIVLCCAGCSEKLVPAEPYSGSEIDKAQDTDSNADSTAAGEEGDISNADSPAEGEDGDTLNTGSTGVETNRDNSMAAIDKGFEDIKGDSELKEIVHLDDDVEGLTGAVAFVRKLRLGWNLGNTMDATSSVSGGANLNLETSWCGVKTTSEMIDTLKDAGFKSIRVPVSWHNHVDGEFNIDEAWLNRVKEIVDYVIDNDMYCTVNIHHDNAKEFFYPTTEYLEQSKKYVRRIWEQVGETFKDYDDHLIFESLNEPRLVGTSNEWSLSNNDMCRDAVKCINELNQVFVDTIRSQGSYNSERYLLVPAYAAQWGAAVSDEFVLPTDTADNKILLEVHAYSPYNFALAAPGDSNSTDLFSSGNNSSTAEINNMMLKLKLNFVDKGIGVVIDEFGARDKSGNLESRTDYAGYYVKKAREFGITCYWWDNNVFFGSGERFGIFDRRSNSIRYPEIVEALVNNCQ